MLEEGEGNVFETPGLSSFKTRPTILNPPEQTAETWIFLREHAFSYRKMHCLPEKCLFPQKIGRKHPSRDVIFSGQKMRKIISLYDVLEPLKQALLASRDVIISSQICASNLQKVFTLGDGCWLPRKCLFLQKKALSCRKKEVFEGHITGKRRKLREGFSAQESRALAYFHERPRETVFTGVVVSVVVWSRLP